MFVESLLESNAPTKTNRRWTTFVSISFQSLAIAALAVLPMFRSDALPFQIKPNSFAMTLGSAQPESKPKPSAAPRPTHSAELVTPRDISNTTESTEADPGPVEASQPPGFPLGSGNQHIALGPIFTSGPVSPPELKPTPPARPARVSNPYPGVLLKQVQPIYPRPAIATHTEGQVVLRAIISRSGEVIGLQVVSGSPFLADAALQAVRQWRYRPYILNGEPVEVDTQITVNFHLGSQ